MKLRVIKDIVRLAATKKNVFNKIAYLFMGLIFLPVLIIEKRRSKEKDHRASDSLAGDDVYPLF